MANPEETSGNSSVTRSRRRRAGWTVRITPAGIVLLVVINLLILVGWTYGLSRLVQSSNLPFQLFTNLASATPPPTLTTTPTVSPSATHTIQPTASSTTPPTVSSTPAPPTASPQPIGTLTLSQGLIILALDEGGNTHLFAYQPEDGGPALPMPLTRITYGPWDDIHPAISPDGQTVAFTSNRNGYWDIYLLDLGSGAVRRLTDSLEYKGAPSWSPDNKWLAYEAYLDGSLEIMIKSVISEDAPITLTINPAADFSPAWSPNGRQILFVSDRSGENEIWLADLDKGEDQRYQDISQSPGNSDSHPAWSPDGSSVVWVSEQDGLRSLSLQKLPPADGDVTPAATLSPQNLGSGDWPVWSADGETVLTLLEAPNRTYLTAYPANQPGLVLPALELPGAINGLSWGNVRLASPIQEIYQPAVQVTPTPLYVPSYSSSPDENGDRYQLAELADVQAPHPYLHDMVDESFQALRGRIGIESGWDVLSTLENAYVPLTAPLDPGMGSDWLYTGRAIALSTLPINAGWMVVVREDFGLDTYWRVYVRALYQDGSAGMPLHDHPWDFNTQNGDPLSYEQGGSELASIPPGYWIDFTNRALAYGWDRLPALPAWRASYPASRFNEFAVEAGLEWHAAMLQLYPPESMITPSPVVPPTRTLTPTPRWYVSPTPTTTSTLRPTLTPIPPTP